MDDIIKQIGMLGKMRNALTGDDNKFNWILTMVKSFEKGDWKNRLFTEITQTGITIKCREFSWIPEQWQMLYYACFSCEY